MVQRANSPDEVPWQRAWELENFAHIFRLIRPPDAETILGDIEIYGDTVFLNRVAGGDHIVYVNFAERYDLDRRIQVAEAQGDLAVARELAENRRRIGILVADVSGHSITDAMVAAMLHQAFLTGVLYELDRFGEVTTRLFENLNSRFYKSLSIEKFITLVYGEISAEGTFRFLSAGSPPPLIFSADYDRFVTISRERLVGMYPLGMFPSRDDVDATRNLGALSYRASYTVNEVNLLGQGDILLLLTDGLDDHLVRDTDPFVPDRLEDVLRATKERPAREIFAAVRDDALAAGPLQDDMSLVVIKRRPHQGGSS
jgi:serine phosphatase RsbU (regulator of sigma subunit)